MSEYHKIQSVFMRDHATNKFILGQWSTPELGYLHDRQWRWEEKIDGTNIRCAYSRQSGMRRIGGKTDNAQIPSKLLPRLEEVFTLERLGQTFPMEERDPEQPVAPINEEVVIYGEGFGNGIQKGGNYLPHPDFILFDVKIGRWWLEYKDVLDIGNKLGCYIAKTVGYGSVDQAIEKVKEGFPSEFGTAQAEGLVLRPEVQLFNRKGERIITKVKTKDFQ